MITDVLTVLKCFFNDLHLRDIDVKKVHFLSAGVEKLTLSVSIGSQKSNDPWATATSIS